VQLIENTWPCTATPSLPFNILRSTALPAVATVCSYRRAVSALVASRALPAPSTDVHTGTPATNLHRVPAFWQRCLKVYERLRRSTGQICRERPRPLTAAPTPPSSSRCCPPNDNRTRRRAPTGPASAALPRSILRGMRAGRSLVQNTADVLTNKLSMTSTTTVGYRAVAVASCASECGTLRLLPSWQQLTFNTAVFCSWLHEA
jgi:hypothetical protein